MTMQDILKAQREASLRDGAPSARERAANIDKTIDGLKAYREKFIHAVAEDFGHRSPNETLMADVMGSVIAAKNAKKHLKTWMKPEKRSSGTLFPGKSWIHYQPMGVIGIMAPWNYPLQLAFAPLVAALAAGNRVMLKPSEYTPRTSELTAQMLSERFSQEEIAVINGGPEVAAEFSKLPFDHLMFTGSTPTGRLVMKAAAENMVPVTLELGGKSPTIIAEDFQMKRATDAIARGKMMNAGQTCIAPDYTFVPGGQEQAFADSMTASITEMYPTLANNDDYTAIVADRHFERINDLLDDAKAKGARAVEINPANEDMGNTRKIAPTLLFDVNEDMKVMQEEIFGPLMPVMPYEKLSDTMDYVNSHDRPLALYVFTNDKKTEQTVVEGTTAGGMTINDTIFHVAVEDLPFGGVGPSGTGAYHGVHGFKTFSHAKGIFKQARFNMAGMMRPPYGNKIEKVANMQMK